jgi:hypothetical protein
MRGITKKLSKDDILEHVSQASIFAFYINVLLNRIDITEEHIDEIEMNNLLINSPIRTDNNPSMGFKYNKKGKLRAKDFAGYFWGDCFDFVGYISNVNVSTKNGFYTILKKIVTDMKINITDVIIEDSIEIKIVRDLVRNRKHVFTIIERDWNDNDVKYWEQYRIDIDFLRMYHVVPVEYYYVDKEIQPMVKYNYRVNDRCYAYMFGKDNMGIDNVELYFPDRGRQDDYSRFITNASVIKGLLNYHNSAETLIITKSYKDVIAIMKFIYDNYRNEFYNTNCIATSGETTYLPVGKLDYLIRTHKRHITLLDFDRAGIQASQHYKKYGFIPLFITNGRFNTINYYAKDFTDFISRTGVKKLKTLMDDIYPSLINVTTIRIRLLRRKSELLRKDNKQAILVTSISEELAKNIESIADKPTSIISIHGVDILIRQVLALGESDTATETQIKLWIDKLDDVWIPADYNPIDNTQLCKIDNLNKVIPLYTQPGSFKRYFDFIIGSIDNPKHILVFSMPLIQYYNATKKLFEFIEYDTVS